MFELHWSLDLGAWDFIGIWILRFGIFHHPRSSVVYLLAPNLFAIAPTGQVLRTPAIEISVN